MSQTLRDARKYEEILEKMIKAEERPSFHLSARTGWLNDPNGFSYYKGEYHLFYQYHPYEPKWGPMYWGHAVSKDLLHWEYRPAAIAPDEPYDRDGCFSGSAIEMPDGKQLLMYTGVVKKSTVYGCFRELQTQCIAVGNGTDYVKYACNPVIGELNLPEGSSRHDFRDPKIWRKKDGSYCCAAGNCTEDGDGRILLFSSEDGFQWNYNKILIENNGRYGKMWECPDFFELNGKWVLLTSPQDMLPQGLEYHNGNGTLCLVGEFDEEKEIFTEQYNQAVDYGIDFYAPQTVLTPDGRRIMIGWMQNWDTCNYEKTNKLWFGQMSLPRELSIRDGRLFQKPVRELEKMRCNKVVYKDVSFSGIKALEGIKGRRVDLELVLSSEDRQNIYEKFEIRFAQNDTYCTSFSFRPKEAMLKIDRRFSGSRRAVIHQRRSLASSRNGSIKLRLILDQYSVEVFVNDGERVMTATMYTEQAADRISFFADGVVRMDVTKYDLTAEE